MLALSLQPYKGTRCNCFTCLLPDLRLPQWQETTRHILEADEKKGRSFSRRLLTLIRRCPVRAVALFFFLVLGGERKYNQLHPPRQLVLFFPIHLARRIANIKNLSCTSGYRA